MKPLALILAFILSCFTVFCSAQTKDIKTTEQVQELRVGMDCTYPPFNYRDSSGELKGFDVDIAEAIGKRLGMKVTYLCQAWDGLIPGLLMGKYDVIIAAMDSTPEREKKMDFSIPYYLSAARFIGPNSMKNAPLDSEGKLSPEFLQGKTIGIQKATIYEYYLRKLYDSIHFSRYDTADMMLLDLKTGRIDLGLGDAAHIASQFLQNPQNQDFTFIGPNIPHKYLTTRAAVGLNKGNDILRSKINAALHSIFEDGTFAKINQRYWPTSVMPEQ